MDPLRLYLLAGMVLHKAVWEAMRRSAPRAAAPAGSGFLKWIKIAALAGLAAQTLVPDVLPLSGNPAALRAAGALLFTAGLALAVTARAQLGRNWADLEDATVLPGQRLVAHGLYRRIRHPIYGGDVMLVLGLELALNSWLVLGVAALGAFVYRKAAREEAILETGLPGYADYRARTGRFLPPSAGAGLLAAALAGGIQFANVQWHFSGNWSALFYTGGSLPLPPALEGEGVYRFANSTGYDSQFYHYMAHDPLMRFGLAGYIDAPRLRYRRILVPAAAYVLALGRSGWIDGALAAVSLVPFFLGAWWLARYAALLGRSPRWGLAFLLLPAALISLDRLTVDLALAAFCCGALTYAREGRRGKLLAVLALAALARETGLLVLGAFGLALLLRREWRETLRFGTAAIPALAWFGFVQARTPGFYSHMSAPPSGSALLDRLFEPVSYPFPPLIAGTAQALDYLSLAGVLVAIGLAARAVIRDPREPAHTAAAMFAALPLALGGIVGWYEPFGYPRILTPLLLFLAAAGLASRKRMAALPLALMLPRILMQLAPQFLGLRQFL